MKKFLLSAFVCVASICSQAQLLQGNWYGVANVMNNNTNISNYMTEVTFQEVGNTIKGQLEYFFRDAHQFVKLEGTINPITREVTLKQFGLLHYANKNTENGADVTLTGEFKLKVSRVETTLEGYLKPIKFYANTTEELKIKLKKYTAQDEEANRQKEIKDSVTRELERVKEIIDLKLTPQNLEVPQMNVSLIDEFKLRRNVVQRVVNTEMDSVTIKLYDNGDVDYDTVSIFLNGVMVKEKQMLRAEPTFLTLHFDKNKDFNDLTLFANNEGDYPPNTALLIMEIDGQRYEMRLSSSFVNNASIRFAKKKKPN
jgi:hypothetical protein